MWIGHEICFECLLKLDYLLENKHILRVEHEQFISFQKQNRYFEKVEVWDSNPWLQDLMVVPGNYFEPNSNKIMIYKNMCDLQSRLLEVKLFLKMFIFKKGWNRMPMW